MKIIDVSLENGRITGELRRPKATKRLTVICHGYQDSRANPTIVALTEKLNRKGHATLTFNFSPSKGGIDIEQQVRDIIAVINRFIEYDDIILLAVSFAALGASIATIQSLRVKGLVTISGFFGTAELGPKYRRTYLKFRLASLVILRLHRIYGYFKRELQPGRIKVPVLVMHSAVDKEVFIVQSQRFYAQLTAPKKFVALKSAAHGLPEDKDRQRCVDEIDTWLPATVQPRRR